MKGKFREIFYLILSIFFLCKLILFSVISPMPNSISYFLILALLGFGTLLFFKKFELEKNDNFMKNISLKMQENTENYLNEKEIETPLELRNLSSSHGLELSLIYIGSASVFFTILFIFSNYIKKMNQMNAKIYVKTKMKI